VLKRLFEARYVKDWNEKGTRSLFAWTSTPTLMCALEDAVMRNDKRTKLIELHGAGSRRVLEAIKMVSEEMSDFDDEEELPQMPLAC